MTLFIAETNDRVRHRLASIAASVEGIEVVGEAGEVGEAVGGIKRAKPDSVIVASSISGSSRFDVFSAAKFSGPTSVPVMKFQTPCAETRDCSARTCSTSCGVIHHDLLRVRTMDEALRIPLRIRATSGTFICRGPAS